MASNLSLTFSDNLNSPHPDFDEVARLSLRVSCRNSAIVEGNNSVPVPVSVTLSSTQLFLNGQKPLEIVLRVPWQYTQYVSMACVTTQIVVEADSGAAEDDEGDKDEDRDEDEDEDKEEDEQEDVKEESVLEAEVKVTDLKGVYVEEAEVKTGACFESSKSFLTQGHIVAQETFGEVGGEERYDLVPDATEAIWATLTA